MYNVDYGKILSSKKIVNESYKPNSEIQSKKDKLEAICVKYGKDEEYLTESFSLQTDNVEFLFEYMTVDLFWDDEDISLESFINYIPVMNSIALTEASKVKDISRKTANKVTTGVRRLDQKISGKTQTVKKDMDRVDKSLSGLVNKKIDSIINTGRDNKREKIITGRTSIKLMKLLKNTIKAVVGSTAATVVLGPVGGTIATITGLVTAYACSKNTEVREKRRILLELETELKIVKEKIEDAKGENDRKQKYELMRIQANLEKEITRIKYNLRHY